MQIFAACLVDPYSALVVKLRVWYSSRRGEVERKLTEELPYQPHPLIYRFRSKEELWAHFQLLGLGKQDFINLDLLERQACLCGQGRSGDEEK